MIFLRRHWFVLTLALLLVFAGSSSVMAQPVNITVAQGADAVTLDPAGQNDQPSARVRSQIYETLVLQDEELNLVPGLAVSWEAVDELTWEFTLREGVYFHNGEPFSAADVKYSLDRLADPATGSPSAFIIGAVSEVTVIDDYTVQVATEFPFAPLLAHLAHNATSIVNQKAVEEAGEDFGTRVAIGTGPFEFVSWSTGSHIVLRRNENYWGENAKPDTVTMRAIPENTVRAIELETGGVDIAYDIDPIDEMRLMYEPGLVLEKYRTLATAYIGFNVLKEPFDNVLVRRAIHHAVDVDAVVEFVYTGQAERNPGPISDMVWAANPNLEAYDFDPDKARELLAEAGYADGFSTSIWTNDNPLRMQIAEIFQANLADVGIDISVEILPWGTYLADTADGKHDMFILGWVTVTGDPDYGLYSLFHSNLHGNAGNRTFYTNHRVDELLDLGRTEADPELRRAYYYEAQELIVEDAPWVFLIANSAVVGYNDSVEGFIPHPAGHHKLKNVSK